MVEWHAWRPHRGGRATLIATLTVSLGLAPAARAQIPNPLDRAKEVVEDIRLPDLDELVTDRPVETSLEDAVFDVPLLDDWQPDTLLPLTELERGPNGEFRLRPGTYTFTAQSYCLHAGTHGPDREGSGYLYAPLRGAQAEAIRTIARNSYLHPDIPQRDIQYLIWAILARSKLEDLRPELRAVAARLLSPAQMATLNRLSLPAVGASALERTLSDAPEPVRTALRAEAEMRELFARGDASYEEIERLAVLPGAAPPDPEAERVPRGRWSMHPNGFFIRYLPSSYPSTRIELAVPSPVTIVRDDLDRIVLLEDEAGVRLEIEYNDAVRPLEIPGDPGVRGYPYRLIRHSRPDPDAPGGRRIEEVRDAGWTFVGVPEGEGRLPAVGDTDARLDRRPPGSGHGGPSAGSPSAGLGSAQGIYEGARARYDQAKAFNDKVNKFNEELNERNRPPSESDLRNLTDMNHYQDGLETALGGDQEGKVDWVNEHGNIVERAWRWASCKLGGGCSDESGSDAGPGAEGGDAGAGGGFGAGSGPGPTYDPSGDIAVPVNRGSQRLQQSARGH